MLSVLEAAKKVLEEAGAPLPVRDLTAAMLSKGYWTTQGLTPEATVQARLASDLKARGDASSFVRPAPGRYGLRGQIPEGTTQPNSAAVQQALFEEEEQDPATSTQTLSFTDAAEQVLQEQVPPGSLHYRDITKIALEKGLLATQGKTPEATMYAQILTEIDRYTKRGLPPRFVKLGQGMVTLAGTATNQPKAYAWSEAEEALLQQIKGGTPIQFEQLVSKLLSLVFGADIPVTPLSNDSGVDARGTVALPAGLEVELVAQAKRYIPNNVRRPEIQNFRGSMGAQSIGVFITTKGFSRGAIEEAKRPSAIQPVGLINGQALVRLMKEHGLTLDAQGEPVLVDDGPVATQSSAEGSHNNTQEFSTQAPALPA